MLQSTKLIVNTAVTMLRMVLTVGIGLVITRLLLKGLGEPDFGVLTAIGASGSLLVMLSDALTFSAVRHMAYEIGREDEGSLREVFMAAVVLYGSLALACLVLGAALAWPVLAVLTIPPGREAAAAWAYGISLLMIVTVLVSTPYRAILESHQAMVITAAFDLLGRVAMLAAVVLMLLLPADRLISYMALSMVSNAICQGVLIGAAMWRYPVARPTRTRITLAQLKELTGFAGWKVLGDLNARLRMQGALVVLNIVYGTIVNAAYAISIQVVGYIQQLLFVVLRAIHPAMVKHVGGERRAIVNDLIVHANVISLLLTSPLLMAVMFDAETLLTLWLGEYPSVTPLFARLSIAMVWLDMLGCGERMAMGAVGKIRALSLIMVLPAMGVTATAMVYVWVVRSPVWVLPAVGVAISAAVNLLLVPILLHRQLNFPTRVWVTRVLGIVLLVQACQAGLSLGLVSQMHPGLLRLTLTVGLNACVSAILGWTLALSPTERWHFKRLAVAAMRRVRTRLQHDHHSA